jgi:hypothetical protein
MGRSVVTLSSWRLESDHRRGGPRIHRANDSREADPIIASCQGTAAIDLNWLVDETSLQEVIELVGVVRHVEIALAADLPGPRDDLDC